MSAASSQPNLIRFQIQRDPDGKYRWYLFTDRGTLLGKHADGFPDESEARRDAELHRDLIAKARIIGSVGE
jgi:hypothetical protein